MQPKRGRFGKIALIIVLVMPTQDGAKLIWSVDYTYRGLSPAALFVRFYFVPRFFRVLEANFRVLETQ